MGFREQSFLTLIDNNVHSTSSSDLLTLLLKMLLSKPWLGHGKNLNLFSTSIFYGHIVYLYGRIPS